MDKNKHDMMNLVGEWKILKKKTNSGGIKKSRRR